MTGVRLRLGVVFAASATLGACNLLFSLDDWAGPSLEPCSPCTTARCQCAPEAPPGFDYVRLRVPAKPEDLCPAGTVKGADMGQGARDTGCACECDSPSPGAPCALAIFAGKSCQGAPAQSISSKSCTALTVSGDSSAAVVPAADATCPALASPRPPDFDVRVLACIDQLPGEAGCAGGTICTAALDAPFDPSPCIMAKPGASVTCPESYSHKYVFDTTFDDQRTCDASDCACSPQECPDTTVSLCQDSACATSCGLSAQSFTNCKDFGGLTYGKVVFDGTTEGQCMPSGTSAASGTLTALGSVVVCCRDTLPKGSPGDGGN